jgi:ADP-ribose pyrophosphatase
MAARKYPESPRVGVGALVIHDGKVLLVKRGIQPSKGLWAVPGGSLELGESLVACAERETLEETGIVIRGEKLVYVYDYRERDQEDRVRYHFVIVDVWGHYVSGEPVGGDDAAEARWAAKEEVLRLPVGEGTLNLLRHVKFLDSPG